MLGAGLMGHGIAQVAAQAGFDVVLREVDQDKLDKGIGKIEKQLARAVEKGKLEQADADGVRGRIQGTLDYGDLADCDLVIEAITEDLDLKLEMWARGRQDRQGGGDLRHQHLLAAGDRPGRAPRRGPAQFFGLHYFNPAQVMKLVEVIRARHDLGRDLRGRGRSSPRRSASSAIPTKDKAGFIVNRLLVPYMLDAMRALRGGRRVGRGDRRGDEGRRRRTRWGR